MRINQTFRHHVDSMEKRNLIMNKKEKYNKKLRQVKIVNIYLENSREPVILISNKEKKSQESIWIWQIRFACWSCRKSCSSEQ